MSRLCYSEGSAQLKSALQAKEEQLIGYEAEIARLKSAKPVVVEKAAPPVIAEKPKGESAKEKELRAQVLELKGDGEKGMVLRGNI